MKLQTTSKGFQVTQGEANILEEVVESDNVQGRWCLVCLCADQIMSMSSLEVVGGVPPASLSTNMDEETLIVPSQMFPSLVQAAHRNRVPYLRWKAPLSVTTGFDKVDRHSVRLAFPSLTRVVNNGLMLATVIRAPLQYLPYLMTCRSRSFDPDIASGLKVMRTTVVCCT